MKHIAAGDPALAALPSVAEAIKAPVSGGDDAAKAKADADEAKAQADADADAAAKSKAEGNQNPDEDPSDEDLEIKPEDDAAKQLEKLRKAQKKVLKRLDGEVAKRKQLETQLAAKKDTDEPAPGLAGDVFPTVQTLQELSAAEQQIDQYLQYLAANTDGTTVKANGKDIELSPAEIMQEVIKWTDVKAKQVPAKRAFLETREKTRTEAAEKFKPWAEKKSFTDAKAEVEQGMRNARAVLPDYDVAVQERALARLVLSNDYELVPKRKAAAAGVESAPAKAKPPVPPADPPNSGGPPVKPAGAGPDLETLKQNMLKQPGNQAAVQALIKAKLAASKQAA